MPENPAEITIYDEVEARAHNMQPVRGYHTGVRSVKRARLTPFKGGDWPKFSFWPVGNPQEDKEYGDEEHTLRIIIGYFDEMRDEPYADASARLKADVVIAMNRATGAPAVTDAKSQDLGGLVESFTITDCEYIISEGKTPWCGCLIEVTITYSSPGADPVAVQVT